MGVKWERRNGVQGLEKLGKGKDPEAAQGSHLTGTKENIHQKEI